MADNPTLARFANQMPEATGLGWNLLSPAPLYTATEQLFYGSGAAINVELPALSLSISAEESISATSIEVTLPNLTVSSFVAELYPPDVFMYLPNITISADVTESQGPASIAVDLPNVSISASAELGLSTSAAITLPNLQVAADLTHTEPAPTNGDTAIMLPMFTINADVTMAESLTCDIATSLPGLSLSMDATSGFSFSLPRAVTTTKISHLILRTKARS